MWSRAGRKAACPREAGCRSRRSSYPPMRRNFADAIVASRLLRLLARHRLVGAVVGLVICVAGVDAVSDVPGVLDFDEPSARVILVVDGFRRHGRCCDGGSRARDQDLLHASHRAPPLQVRLEIETRNEITT